MFRWVWAFFRQIVSISHKCWLTWALQDWYFYHFYNLAQKSYPVLTELSYSKYDQDPFPKKLAALTLDIFLALHFMFELLVQIQIAVVKIVFSELLAGLYAIN